MAILTDTNIEEIVCVNEEEWRENPDRLLINGFSEDCLTPMGYDLRVGGFYKTFIARPNLVTLKMGSQAIIKSRDIALISTLEKVRMPQDGSVSALILSKVSQVAQGLSHISTKVDPGWAEGELLIPVQNISRQNIKLDYGDKFCTIVFFKNESPPKKLYDSGTSRAKLVSLLAQTSQESLARETRLFLAPVAIVVGFGFVGYFLFGNNAGFGATVAIGVALSQVTSLVLSRLVERR